MLADDKLLSTSSGRSTDPVFIPRVAYSSFLCAEGLDGAEIETNALLTFQILYLNSIRRLTMQSAVVRWWSAVFNTARSTMMIDGRTLVRIPPSSSMQLGRLRGVQT